MKLPENTIIASEKLISYLLVFKQRNDKSQWLATAGYTLKNWQQLENDLRTQILSGEAVATENTPYGQMYEIVGSLTGTNGKSLLICSVWMTELTTNITKFITLFPHKDKQNEISTL